MSDSQKLKDSISEFNKANKKLGDKVNKAQENSRQAQKEREGQPNRN